MTGQLQLPGWGRSGDHQTNGQRGLPDRFRPGDPDIDQAAGLLLQFALELCDLPTQTKYATQQRQDRKRGTRDKKTSKTITRGACQTVSSTKRTPTGSVFLMANAKRKRKRTILDAHSNARINHRPTENGRQLSLPPAIRHALTTQIDSSEPSTRSRSSLPALKCGTHFSGTSTLSPDFGLRPTRGGR
jgi:hypothetical protein